MNPYEISELEGKDLFCENCGKLISSKEYLEFNGLCAICFEDFDVPVRYNGSLAQLVRARGS